ncbi:hypothetical protein GCM10022243_02720 [Saccharothrix violaceirubra]|uniref:Uncharacterized protein n=1 Tax=Saccharothrix violaceirubra TaxID=413306 RepID=A0A7W7WWX3_9PSEU|nr:hypothetical protein [Saccharothrix violaceirubra]MBB4966033.1 hypothetical protein [Saccharothrix violaceirubra]
MSVTPKQLSDELHALCRGQGVQAPGIDKQVGPALREVCGIGKGDAAEIVRTKVTAWVTGLTDQFPTDLRLLVLVPLGLHEDAQNRFLSERIDWLAGRLERGARTVRRRVASGVERLVEAGLNPDRDGSAAPADPWHVAEFDALLRLDGLTPTCTERRTVVADRDGIDEIEWSITLPAASDDGVPGHLDVQVLQGVELVESLRPSSRRWLLRLRLPHRLDSGQRHRFALEVRVPVGQAMRPTYVFWPERRCERFRLVVRFPRHDLPGDVWRVDGALHRDTDDLRPGVNRLAVNDIGEVEVNFPHPREGRGYGVQWRETSGID